MAWYECIGGSGGGSSHNYSTDEQIVGTWIDGKTLYEKTKYLSNYAITANTSQNIPLSIGNIEKVVSCNGSMSNSTKTTWRALPFYDVGAPTDSTFIWIDTSKDNLILRSNSNWTSSDILITVRYTKSSL
jgi:hypothetical protein